MIKLNIKNKVIRYIIAFILFLCAVAAFGEFNYLSFISNLDDRECIQCEIGNVSNWADIMKETSQKYDVELYIDDIDYSDGFLHYYRKIINLSDSKNLGKHLNINSDSYKSILFGQIDISYIDIYSGKNIGNCTCIHMIGSEDNKNLFMSELENQIEIKYYMPSDIHDYSIIIYIIWAVFAVFLLILTSYDVNCNKKEVFIRQTFGEKKFIIFIESVIPDVFIYFTEYLVVRAIVSRYSFTEVFSIPVILLFIITMILLFLPYLSYLCTTPQILKKGKYSKGMIRLNKVFVCITSILSISIIMLMLKTNDLYNDYTKFKQFTEIFDGYSVCDIQYAYVNDLDTLTLRNGYVELNEKIYRECYKELEPVLFIELYADEKNPFIYANSNAYSYITNELPEINSDEIDSDICFLVPDSLSEAEINNYCDEAKKITNFYEGKTFTYSFKVIKYSKSAEFIVLNDLETSGLNFFETVENPLIILNTISADTLTSPLLESNRLNAFDTIIYNIDQDQIDLIKQKYNLQREIFDVSNIREHYIFYYTMLKSIVRIVTIVTISILLLTIMFNLSVIKITYDLNAVELALKKVMGYTAFEKNFREFLLIIISCILSGIINMLIFKNNMTIILCLSLMAAMLIFVAVQISFSEKSNVNTVIKSRK